MTSRPDDKAPSYTHFPHHSLDAYGVALEALVKADSLAKKLAERLRAAQRSASARESVGVSPAQRGRRAQRR
jgi:hypothetical protein